MQKSSYKTNYEELSRAICVVGDRNIKCVKQDFSSRSYFITAITKIEK